jgi:hypothetical protein
VTKQQSMRAARARARKLGICIVCLHYKVRRGKVTCTACNESAKKRVKAYRKKLAEADRRR